MSERRVQYQDTVEIRALLVSRAESLARELAPEGRRASGYWIARNPTRADRHAGSFWIRIDSGAWKDEATGETGDVFKLIGYVLGLASFKDQVAWARGFLGLGAMPAGQQRRAAAEASETQQVREREQAEKAEKARRAAHAHYLDARRRPFPGSPADRYLKTRGIDVSALGRMPGVLGWLPEQPHAESGGKWPVMLAGFTAPSGEIVAIHRTWLARDGSGKAPVSPARKIWPRFSGAAIRLWRGESGLSADAAARQGLLETLVLVEGVEDGLSVALACPDRRIWCAGSLGNLAALRLPACADRVIVCADNDWGKPQAGRQLDRAVAHLIAQGAEVAIARSPIGKDVNDGLMGRWQ